MSHFLIKFKRIVIPFILLNIITVAVYTFLHWLLFIKNSSFEVDEEVLNLWGPMVIPFIPILIWLRPRIKLLNLKNKSGKGDPLMGYIMFSWIAMAVPIGIAQSYMVTATGKLTQLNNIGEISNLPPTKYYTANRFYVNKNFAHVKFHFNISGKHNEDFDMAIYVSVPVFAHLFPDTTIITNIINRVNIKTLVFLNGKVTTIYELKKLPADSIRTMRYLGPLFIAPQYGDVGKYGAIVATTMSHRPKNEPAPIKISPAAWLAIKYTKTIDNDLSRLEKNDAFKEFLASSNVDFKSKALDKFTYLSRVPYNRELKYYIDAIELKDDVVAGKPVILLPVYEPFADRNGNKLAWVFGALGIGSVIFMIILLFKPLNRDALNEDFEKLRKRELESTTLWLKGLFSIKSEMKATRLLIGINLLMFIIMVCVGLGFISFETPDLLKWGANYSPLVIEGQYWRLLTNIFLHGGFLHILLNMYGLFFVGLFLERVIGSKKFLIAYLATGIFASITSAWWHVATVSVGASGAIFGMYGVFFALLTVNLFPSQLRKPFLISTSIFIVYNLLNGLTGGIDNAAHIGGLISGLLIGYLMYPTIKNNANDTGAEDETQKILNELTGKQNKQLTEGS